MATALGTTNLTGGESVFCINETQMTRALSRLGLSAGDSELARIFREARTMDRNDQAALAFGIIQALRTPGP